MKNIALLTLIAISTVVAAFGAGKSSDLPAPIPVPYCYESAEVDYKAPGPEFYSAEANRLGLCLIRLSGGCKERVQEQDGVDADGDAVYKYVWRQLPGHCPATILK